ncbi:MAG: helix-hairpin-helix domain-containing protein [Rubricoccaceae bacterium]|nr:helix-hairpin-helix domain-containing protein [Rubricoccaceae bacterium]
MARVARSWLGERGRGGLAALCVLAALHGPPALAQPVPADTTATPDETETLETLTEDDFSGDPTELLELIIGLREDPLDVNTATATELALVPAFSPLLAQAIVNHREARGPFGSLPELQQVGGVTAEVYLAARPYLRIGAPEAAAEARPPRYPPVPSVREVVEGLRYTGIQRVQRRLDLAAGYLGEDSLRAYAGSPDRIYTRLQARYRRNVSVNVTLEKDPGERFTFDGQPGYDYVSAHAGVFDLGRVDALVVGDFAAEYGQGLVLWRSAGFGKGPDAARAPIRSGRGLRPYGSVDENQFFRGAAASVAVVPGLYASAFGSRRTLDASVVVPDSVDLLDPEIPPGFVDGFVTSLPADGFHRTDTELARKDALGETLVGGGLEYRIDARRVAGTVGVVGYRARFDDPIAPGDRPYERFDFAGEEATTGSVYADLRTRSLQAFGEVARGPGGALGALGGVAAEVSRALDLLVLGRHYARNFTSLHGYPFGERNGVGQNETGIYTGVRLRPSRTLTITAYLDQYRFPWLRFAVPRPSSGHEAMLFVEHRPRRWLRFYVQARTETKEAGTDVPGGVPGTVVGGLVNETRQTLRLHGEYEASRSLRLRARVEGSRYVEAGEVNLGVLVYQDVRWQALDALRLDARLTFFDTDGYDARLYQYENDLTYVFSIPVLFGRGVRTYVLATLVPAEGLTLQAKYGVTVFEDVTRVSSGNNEIEGNVVRDLGLQLRVRL